MDETLEDEDGVMLIDFEYEFTTIRVTEQTFVPSRLTVKAEILATEAPVADFDLALTKIRFWLDGMMARSIIFCRRNSHALAMLLDDTGKNRSSNILMLTPADPTDDHLAALLQAKMTALAGGTIAFGTTEIKSDNTAGLTFTFIGDCADVLPSMEEWIGKRSYFAEPWWFRDDASTLDVVPSEDADLTQTPSWAYKLDFLEHAMRGTKEEVLVRPDFKPQVIDGGKGDK